MTRPNPQEEPDPSDEDSPMDLRSCVAGLANAVFKGVSNEVAVYDLTAIEFNLLRACLDAESEITATELAQLLPVDTSRISRIVTNLVDKGLLRRRRLPDDRRVVMLSLSEEGEELTSRILERMKLHDATLVEGVDEDQMRAFVSVTSKILTNYAAMQKSE